MSVCVCVCTTIGGLMVVHDTTQHNRPAADQHVLEVVSIIPTADLLTAAVCLQPTSLAMSKHLFGGARCRLGNENIHVSKEKRLPESLSK